MDSSGWFEWFVDPMNAAPFERPILDKASLIVPTIVIYEVHRVIAHRIGQEIADQHVASMSQGIVVDLDSGIAVLASQYARQFKLAVADAIIYATARSCDAVLWTQDAHFDGLSHVRYFPKPSPTA